MKDKKPKPTRHHPVHGVDISNDFPTIVFITVCTKNRIPWLANSESHQILKKIWSENSPWRVGRYVLLPDHLHLFASPYDSRIQINTWIEFWKSRFRQLCSQSDYKWQTDFWDRRLRRWESYEEKWMYVKNNPVRHGLVTNAENWPYCGEINALTWH